MNPEFVTMLNLILFESTDVRFSDRSLYSKRSARLLEGAESLSSWYISDYPITASEDDEFDHDTIAAEVVNAIRSEPSVLCVGLIGGFGTGKTSIANLAMARLGNDPTFDPIRVSADRHSGVARSRNIVHSVATELQRSRKIKERDIQDALRPLSSSVSISSRASPVLSFPQFAKVAITSTRVLWIVIGGLVVTVGAVLAYFMVGEDTARFGSSIGMMVGLISTGGAVLWGAMGERIRAMFEGATIQDAAPRAEASDDVERVFARLVEIHHDKQKGRRLVIFVDDIDRLDPDDVLEALRAIKSLQTVPRGKEPVFVVSCDERVVIGAIAKAGDAPTTALGDSTKTNAAKSFLDKYFNLRVVVPLHVPGDMREYATSLIPQDHPLRQDLQDRFDKVVRILIPGQIESPRKVVRRLNDFLAIFHIAKMRERKSEGDNRIHQGDVTGHPEFLARLSVLREDFPAFYARVVVDHDLLEAADRFLLGQRLTASQEDVLERHQLFAKRIESGEPEDGVKNAESLNRIWGGTDALRGYLMSTARYLPGKHPGRLTALIYLSHSPTGRVLGNARVARLVDAVMRGDKMAVEKEVKDSPAENHATIAAELASFVQGTAPIDLVNVIAGSVGAIPSLSVGSDMVADAIAESLQRARDVVVVPSDLVLLLENSGQLHRNALQQTLIADVPSEDEEDRDLRMQVAAEYLSRFPEADRVSKAIEDHLKLVHEQAGWEVGRIWLKLSEKFDRTEFAAFLDNHLLPALIRMARRTKAFTLDDDGPAFVELARSAQPDDPDGILDEICALTDDDPELLMLAGRLIEALDSPGTSDASKFLAHLVGVLNTSLEDRRAGIERLAQWAPVWHDVLVPTVDSDGDENEEDLDTVVADSVAAAVTSSAELTDSAMCWLRAAVDEGQSGSTSSVVEAVAVRITESIQADDAVALAQATAILELLDGLDESESETVVEALLAPLEQRVATNAPAVRIGLQLIEPIANSKAGQNGLSNRAVTWQTMLADLTRSPETCIAALNRLGEVAPEIRRPLDRSLYQQLGIRRGYSAGPTVDQLNVIAAISWGDEVLSEALALLSDRWTELSVDSQMAVFQQLSTAVEVNADVPDELFELLVDQVCEAPLSEAGYFADTAWSGFTDEQRGQIAAVAFANPVIQKKMPNMTITQLGFVFTEAIRRSSLRDFLAVPGVPTNVAASAAVEVLQHAAETSDLLEQDDAQHLVALLSGEQRQALGEALIVSLPDDNRRALATVRILNCLDLDLERPRVSELVVQLLPEASEGLASELGHLEGPGKLPKTIPEIMKNLRASGRESIANAFDAGRKNSGRR